MIIELTPHKFEYQGIEYNIIGMQGCKPLRVQNIGIEIPRDEIVWWLQAYGSGYVGTYGAHETGQFALKKVWISNTWEREINQVIPMTGHVLFSDLPGIHCFDIEDAAILSKVVSEMHMFEAEVVAGAVTQIRDCTQEVETRLMTMQPEAMSARLRNETYWDWTAHFLPRRYELLAQSYSYVCYPECMPLMRM